MRTTITIADDLYADASRLAGLSNASELVKLSLKKYVTSVSAKRLIALGGTMPDFTFPGRSITYDANPTKANHTLNVEPTPYRNKKKS